MKKSYILAALCATATCAATVASAEVKSSVFDDVKVWYRGALAAESYYSNGPEGTFANNGGAHPSKSFKSITCFSDSGNALNNLAWSWGWGAETTLDTAPVVCPYAGCTLTNVTYANRPIPAKTNDWADVTINDATTSQPILSHWKGPEYLQSGNWASGISTYTMILRLRLDTPLNNHAGSQSGDGFSIFVQTPNYSWNAKTGFRITFNGPTLGTYRYPRIDFGNNRTDLSNAIVPYGNWIDIAVAVNGQSITLAACAQGESANALDWKTITLSNGENPALPASGNTFVFFGPEISGGYTAVWTNGVKCVQSSSAEACMRTQCFRGAVHQIAFWDRALSADEIREAWGEGRPNLVSIGIEGNGTTDFAASTNAVSNGGAWQLLNPALTAENPSATIAFNCPALWAGMPQWLRIAGAGAGKVSVSLNNEALGTVNIHANGASSFFVPEGKILSGANTLVLTRTSASPVLDAVRLGGSWKFGESVSSFNSTAVSSSLASTIGVDCWKYHPACGNDKLHARGTTWSINGDNLSFPFFVPSDMVGKFRGVLTFKSATAGSTPVFKWLVNDANVCEDTSISGQSDYSTTVAEAAFDSGWNEAVWHRTTGWINFNSFQFTLVDAPKPSILVLE